MISESKLCLDLPFSEYLEIEAVNAGALKDILFRGPAAYAWKKKNPMEDKDAFRLGRAVHTLSLEPHNANFATFSGRRSGKKWECFLAENVGKEILTEAELDVCRQQAAGILRACPLLKTAMTEVTYTWKHNDTPCKGRADAVSNDCLYDVKTTTRFNLREMRNALEYGEYPVQFSFYLDGAEAKEFYVVWSNKNPPYDAAVMRVSENHVQRGRKLYNEALETYRYCQITGEWPGLYDGEILESNHVRH